MTTPRYTPLAEALPSTVPFVGPEALERQRGRAFAARLGANESLFGPSPAAVAAMQRAAADVWMYGDPEAHELREAIAAHHRLSPANVILGEGIDALLGLLVRLTVTAGDCVVTSEGAYPTFNFHVAGFGGQLHKVPYRGDHEDPEALVARAAETGAKLIYLANPDNPMGSCHPAATIKAMLDALPDGTLLVLDEAYIELAPEGSAAEVEADDPRLIRFRTFSKAYGMAGLRVGYGLAAPDLIRAFDKVRNHFGLGRLAQAGALAAIQDPTWIPHVRAEIASARETLVGLARANGLEPLASATNFMALDCGADGDFARRLLGALAARDIFVRMPGVSPLDRCIRISLGDQAAMAKLAEALPAALQQARAASISA